MLMNQAVSRCLYTPLPRPDHWSLGRVFPGDIDVNLATLDTGTLRRMQQFVAQCLRNSGPSPVVQATAGDVISFWLHVERGEMWVAVNGRPVAPHVPPPARPAAGVSSLAADAPGASLFSSPPHRDSWLRDSFRRQPGLGVSRAVLASSVTPGAQHVPPVFTGVRGDRLFPAVSLAGGGLDSGLRVQMRFVEGPSPLPSFAVSADSTDSNVPGATAWETRVAAASAASVAADANRWAADDSQVRAQITLLALAARQARAGRAVATVPRPKPCICWGRRAQACELCEFVPTLTVGQAMLTLACHRHDMQAAAGWLMTRGLQGVCRSSGLLLVYPCPV